MSSFWWWWRRARWRLLRKKALCVVTVHFKGGTERQFWGAVSVRLTRRNGEEVLVVSYRDGRRHATIPWADIMMVEDRVLFYGPTAPTVESLG